MEDMQGEEAQGTSNPEFNIISCECEYVSIESEGDWTFALPNSLRAELLDPFQTHPGSRLKGIDVLMKHCWSVFLYMNVTLADGNRSRDCGVQLFPLAASLGNKHDNQILCSPHLE